MYVASSRGGGVVERIVEEEERSNILIDNRSFHLTKWHLCVDLRPLST